MTIAPHLTAILALLCYASLPIIAKGLHGQITPFIFMALVNGMVGVISLMLAFIFEKPVVTTYSSVCLGKILFFSVVNVAAFWAFLFSSNRLPIAEYQLFIVLSPLVGGTLAWIFLGEPFEVKYLVSFIIIFTGLFVALKT